MRTVSAGKPLSAAFLLVSGFAGWSLAFVLLYALLSFGCAYGWDATSLGPVSLNRVVLVAAWLACCAAVGILLLATVRLFRAGEGVPAFLRASGIALTGFALAATAANFFMVATLSTCL